MTREVFEPRAALVDAWCQSPSSSHPLLDTLREVNELKKLNANLIKPTAFEELLADTYAAIFSQIGPMLGEPLAPAPQREHTATPGQGTPTKSTPAPTPERANKMALDNLMNIDGVAEARSTTPLPQPTLGSTGEAPLKPRVAAKIVTRTVILKHASDAAVSKAAPGNGAPASASLKGAGAPEKRNSASSAKHPAKGGSAELAGGKRSSVGGGANEGEERDGEGAGNGADAGNDADSELSDQPEHEEERPVRKRVSFPNLVARKGPPPPPPPAADEGEGEDENGDDSFRTANEEGDKGEGEGEGGGDADEPVSPLTTGGRTVIPDTQDAGADDEMEVD